MHDDNDALRARGGSACRTGPGEAECIYCAVIIPIKRDHLTCASCARAWVSEFGLEWYLMPFHAELFAGALALWRSNKNAEVPVVPSKRQALSARAIESTIRFRTYPCYNAVYAAVRDIVLTQYFARNPEAITKFPAWATRAIGAVQAQKILISWGFDAKALPTARAIKSYLESARAEVEENIRKEAPTWQVGADFAGDAGPLKGRKTEVSKLSLSHPHAAVNESKPITAGRRES